MMFVEHSHWRVTNLEAKKKFYSLMASTRASCDLVARREKAIFGHVDSQGIKHEGLLDALASASSGEQESIAEELRSIEEELFELSTAIAGDAGVLDSLFPDGKVARTQPGEINQLSYDQNAKIELKNIEDMIFKFTLAMFEIAPRGCPCGMQCDIHDGIRVYDFFKEQPMFEQKVVESSEMFLEPQGSQSEIEMAYVLPAIQQSMGDDLIEDRRNEEEELSCNYLASFDAAEPRRATHAELQQDFLYKKMDQFLDQIEVCIATHADSSHLDTQAFLSQSPMKNLLILEEQLHHVVQGAHAMFKLNTHPFYIPQNLSSKMEVGTKGSHADIFCLVSRNDEISQDCREIPWPPDNPD